MSTQIEHSPATGKVAEPSALPREPILYPQSSDEVDGTALRAARSFHLGRQSHLGRQGHLSRQSELQPIVAGAYLPALTWPYRDPRRVRTTYPLLFAQQDDGLGPRPLSIALAELVPPSARMLRDNLLRLEQLVRAELGSDGPLHDGRQAFEKAADRLVQQLQLRGKSDEGLRAEVDELKQALPAQSQLLTLGPGTDLALLTHVALKLQRERRAAFAGAIANLAAQLRALLAIERQKAPEARSPDTLGQSLGPASHFVDPQALAGVVGPQRGSPAMEPVRRNRIEQALAQLERGIGVGTPLLCVLSDAPGNSAGADRSSGCETIHVTDPFASAIERFDMLAERYLDLFRALRVAQLELEGPRGAYAPERHDALLAALDWRALSDEELQQLPVVVAVTREEKIRSGGLASLSQLLLSNRPIVALASVVPTGISKQAELGYLALGHRRALVWQTAAAVPNHFVRGVQRALESSAPALLLAVRDDTPSSASVGTELYTAAAVESRAHPLFSYDPQSGRGWARRFDLSENPRAAEDWSQERLYCNSPAGAPTELELAFTFADFCLLHPDLSRHFCPLPASCAASDALTPLSTYLDLEADEASGHIPFVWSVQRDSGNLVRLIVSRELVLACRDRRDLWQTLQELAGIRSEHVERAVAAERDRAAAELRRRLDDLEQTHADALERLRREAASDVLGRLAESLVGLTPTNLGTAARGTPQAPRATQTPTVSATPAVSTDQPAPEHLEPPPAKTSAEEPAEDDEPEEPWIDSALCSSCNDCIGLNPRLFVYNANKQAEIGDPQAGTFADLVMAAEKCPARCIHPGKPLNPDEPDLAQLLERASKFT